MSDEVLISLIAALSAAVGAAIIRGLDWWAARKLGIGKLQRELIDTLQSTNLAYRERVLVLDATATAAALEQARLTGRVEALEGLLRDALSATAIPAPRRRRSPTSSA